MPHGAFYASYFCLRQVLGAAAIGSRIEMSIQHVHETFWTLQ